MIGRILQLEDGKAIINVNVMIIPEFRNLHDHYMEIDSTGSVLSIALAYIFALYDPESPYFNLLDYEKESKIAKDFRHELFRPDEIVFVKALDKAKELYSTPTQRLLNSLKVSMDKISQYLTDTDIEGGRDGNFDSILRAHKEAAVILKNYKMIETEFFKETSKSRGNSISAIDENDEDDDF